MMINISFSNLDNFLAKKISAVRIIKARSPVVVYDLENGEQDTCANTHENLLSVYAENGVFFLTPDQADIVFSKKLPPKRKLQFYIDNSYVRPINVGYPLLRSRRPYFDFQTVRFIYMMTILRLKRLRISVSSNDILLNKM